jgi:hypothetical protein
VCRFLHRQRGLPIPSSAAFGQIGEAYVAEIHRWAKANGIPVRYFAKNENKEKIAEPLLRAAAEEGGDGKVVLIGIAQEKASTWRSWKKQGQEHAAHPHMEWGRPMAFINHFYVYLWDPEWGPAFWKTYRFIFEGAWNVAAVGERAPDPAVQARLVEILRHSSASNLLCRRYAESIA